MSAFELRHLGYQTLSSEDTVKDGDAVFGNWTDGLRQMTGAEGWNVGDFMHSFGIFVCRRVSKGGC